jgi:DNA-binding IclR family transcriptional regulator
MSSCHDVVHTLAAKGYVYETAPRSGYYPTRKLHDIATTIADHDSLLPRASAYLEDAMNSLEETVCLAKARNMSATYLAVIEPPNPLRVSVAVGGQIRSIFATSAGKAILGDLPEDEFEIFMKSARLKRLTPHTILSKVKFVEEIRVSRERGWYINKEESLLGVVTVSSQFRWNDALYIMTIAGPADRMTRKIRAAVEEVLQTCRALSAPKS